MERDREAFRAWCKSAPKGWVLDTPGRWMIWQAALAYARREGEADGWRPISEPPDTPMPVIFYSVSRDFGGEGPLYPEAAFAEQPYRDERCDLGYWDGTEWCCQGTGHAVWENPEDESDPDLPTHWKPLGALPSPVTESSGSTPPLNVSATDKD